MRRQIMAFNPREPKEYSTANDETLIALGVGHGGDFSGSVIVEATRRLRQSIDEFNKASATANETLRRSIDDFNKTNVSGNEALRRSIDEFNVSSTRQATTMIRLGWATMLLSIVMLVFTGVQVWLALRH